jgi:hypothetical protein
MCSATVLSVTGRTKVNQNPRGGPQAGSGPADAIKGWRKMRWRWGAGPAAGASPRSLAVAYQDPSAGVLIAAP